MTFTFEPNQSSGEGGFKPLSPEVCVKSPIANLSL